MKSNLLKTTAFLGLGLLMAACSSNEDSIVKPVEKKYTFKVTLKNAINYLNVKKVGEGPLKETGEYHMVKFKATKGTYVSFANMWAQSNDWFFGTKDTGIKLWDGDTPKTGDITNYIKVWDAGTEEDEDGVLTDFANTKYTAPNQSAPNMGPKDDNNVVRDLDRNISNYLTANLTYDSDTKYFTLKIKKADRSAAHNKAFITPGILVVHAQPKALFEEGMPARANGLESLAEDGSPMAIYDWFNEKGTEGAPLRLSSSYSPLSPVVGYVHSGEQSPFFTKGSAARLNSGLEELAEDGKNAIAVSYLNEMDNVTALAAGSGPVFPGEEIFFEIEASKGQRLNFATMLISTNDWFISNNQKGIELFDEAGMVKENFEINKNYLYDSGTESDQTVGAGNGQPMLGNAVVADDADTTVRRVTKIDDVQFGKGKISSKAGVTQDKEVRGGYNLIDVKVELVK
jgi:hypothetical protein